MIVKKTPSHGALWFTMVPTATIPNGRRSEKHLRISWVAQRKVYCSEGADPGAVVLKFGEDESALQDTTSQQVRR
jgi:hypothetical protein